MCLAIPARIVDADDSAAEAVIDVDGVRRRISTMLLDAPPAVGDWVVVHVGFAIAPLDESEALETLRLVRTAVTGREDVP